MNSAHFPAGAVDQQAQAYSASLEAQLTTLQQQAASNQSVSQSSPSPPGGRTPSHSSMPKLPPPPSFSGTAAELDSWLADLQQQFDWYGMQSEADRLRFAAAFLRGAARDWWATMDAATRPRNWSDFGASLRRRFQPVDSATTARAKLLSLTQGKAAVQEYIAAFRSLLPRVPDMSEADRLFQFLRGLRPAIATTLKVHGVGTLDAAVEMAGRIGGLQEHGAVNSALAAASTSSNATAPMELDALLNGVEGLEQETDTPAAEGSTAVTRADLQQLLNAMRFHRASVASKKAAQSSGPRPLPTVAHLTPAQVQEYMDAGKCFHCGSTDHMGRGCKNRRPNPNNVNKRSSN